MLDEFKNIKSTQSDLKKFGNTIGIVSLLITIILFLYNKDSYLLFIIIGAVLLISGNLFPQVLKPLQKFWMGLAIVLGWFSTRIILGILFYLIMTPIKFTALLFGKKFLDLDFRKNTKTYWNYRERKELTAEDYEKQF